MRNEEIAENVANKLSHKFVSRLYTIQVIIAALNEATEPRDREIAELKASLKKLEIENARLKSELSDHILEQ